MPVMEKEDGLGAGETVAPSCCMPCASPARMAARCEMLLSPGTVMSPRRGWGCRELVRVSVDMDLESFFVEGFVDGFVEPGTDGEFMLGAADSAAHTFFAFVEAWNTGGLQFADQKDVPSPATLSKNRHVGRHGRFSEEGQLRQSKVFIVEDGAEIAVALGAVIIFTVSESESCEVRSVAQLEEDVLRLLTDNLRIFSVSCEEDMFDRTMLRDAHGFFDPFVVLRYVFITYDAKRRDSALQLGAHLHGGL